jgi:hypothetical protein
MNHDSTAMQARVFRGGSRPSAKDTMNTQGFTTV